MIPIKAANFECNISGIRHRIWCARLDEGQTIDDALDRNAWKHVMARNAMPQPGDRIEIRSFDDSEFYELFVQGAGQGWLKVTLIGRTKPSDAAEVDAGSPLEPRWNVGRRAYDVIRKSDRQVVQAGIKLKEDAVAWIADHLRQMAA